jgi:hypothetical protein
MQRFRHKYGAGPLHLLGCLACFAVALYALTRVHDEGALVNVVAWFVICLILHDLIGWPLYTLADRWVLRLGRPSPLRRRPAVPWINHVRVPVVISATLLVISFPLVARLANAYYFGVTGFTEDVYVRNWLAVTAGLFAVSGLIYLLRLGLARRRAHSETR